MKHICNFVAVTIAMIDYDMYSIKMVFLSQFILSCSFINTHSITFILAILKQQNLIWYIVVSYYCSCITTIRNNKFFPLVNLMNNNTTQSYKHWCRT